MSSLAICTYEKYAYGRLHLYDEASNRLYTISLLQVNQHPPKLILLMLMLLESLHNHHIVNHSTAAPGCLVSEKISKSASYATNS